MNPHTHNCDVIYDGKIDMKDIGTTARHFGETDPQLSSLPENRTLWEDNIYTLLGSIYLGNYVEKSLASVIIIAFRHH